MSYIRGAEVISIYVQGKSLSQRGRERKRGRGKGEREEGRDGGTESWFVGKPRFESRSSDLADTVLIEELSVWRIEVHIIIWLRLKF